MPASPAVITVLEKAVGALSAVVTDLLPIVRQEHGFPGIAPVVPCQAPALFGNAENVPATSVDISNRAHVAALTSNAEAEVDAAPRRRGRPPGSKNKAAETPAAQAAPADELDLDAEVDAKVAALPPAAADPLLDDDDLDALTPDADDDLLGDEPAPRVWAIEEVRAAVQTWARQAGNDLSTVLKQVTPEGKSPKFSNIPPENFAKLMTLIGADKE